MWGTIARMRVREGVPDEYLLGQVRALNTDRMKGWKVTTIYRSDVDPRELWMVAMFEDKESYRANAESAAQHSVFLTLRACLDEDPEWHDVDELVTFS